MPLSEEGRAQALLLADALCTVVFDRAIASDLSRATETARILLGDRDLAIEPEPRLRELNFGAWEGLTWTQIVSRWPHLRKRGQMTAKHYQPEGGEAFADVTVRMVSFLNDLRTDHAKQVLVVTHAGALHAIFAALGGELQDAPIDTMNLRFLPASLTRITMNAGSARLIVLNDVTHLNSTL